MSLSVADHVWLHDGLQVRGGRLTIAGRDAEELARRHGTPLYVFDLQHIGTQLATLRAALAGAGLRPRVRMAIKAQREPEVLRYVRGLGAPGEQAAVGIDACSPGEVLHALAHGWQPQEISFTGTNVSRRDLDAIAALPIHINVDLLTQIERLGRRCPGRAIGLRINPRAGVMRGRAEGSLYSGARPTKFGIYEEDLDEALEVARRHRLTIDTVHFHLANDMLSEQVPAFEEALGRAAGMIERLHAAGCALEEINVGGGLGTPLHEGERPLDLDAYAAAIARRLGPFGLAIGVEPGEFVFNQSAVLLTEVVTVERRAGVPFVGLDAGWNVLADHFIYGRRLELVLCRDVDAPGEERTTISGHINEGNDLFAEDYPFPPVDEDDVVAILSVGSYNQAMTNRHCLRPPADALYFADRR